MAKQNKPTASQEPPDLEDGAAAASNEEASIAARAPREGERSPAPERKTHARQGSELRPVCPWHKVACSAQSTKGPITYYRCPTKGCSFHQKRFRKEAVGGVARPRRG